MTKTLATILATVLSVGVLSNHAAAYDDSNSNNYVEFRRHSGDFQDNFRRKHNYPNQQSNTTQSNDNQGPSGSGDSAIVNAIQAHRNVDFVEGSGMVVVKLLPDDTNGAQHQKWIVRLSNGLTMQAVYNTDMCEHVPLNVGDVVSMGGQFIMTNQGPLLHWLHYDPRQNRPDGYVEVNGKDYCKDGPRHN